MVLPQQRSLKVALLLSILVFTFHFRWINSLPTSANKDLDDSNSREEAFSSESESGSSSEEQGCGAANPCKEEGHIFDIERKNCFLPSADECPDYMRLMMIPDNNKYGFCDCYSKNPPTIYNSTTNSCDLLYRQSYCSTGQWLLPDKNNSKAICFENNCESLRTSKYEEIAMYKGNCVKIGDQHPDCPEGQGEALYFTLGEYEPVCTPAISTFSFGTSVPHLQCSSGTKWSHLTQSCTRTYRFKFS